MLSVLQCTKYLVPTVCSTSVRSYAAPSIFGLGKSKKMVKGKGPTVEKKRLPVEEDVERLLKYCCGTNLLKEGGEDVLLKPKSEYPDWLWKINVGPPPKLEDLDPNTKAYWRKLRKEGMKRNNKLSKLKKF